jgi:hypothetical protein
MGPYWSFGRVDTPECFVSFASSTYSLFSPFVSGNFLISLYEVLMRFFGHSRCSQALSPLIWMEEVPSGVIIWCSATAPSIYEIG